jgi:AcrR family transcriptional regulator
MSEPKNTRILQVAERLFAEKGFDGTSIRDIAAEAGANISMISYYFGSKENLMVEIIRSRISESIRLLDEVMADDSLLPVQKIETFVGRFIQNKIEHACFSRILMAEQILKRNESFVALLSELRMTLANHLGSLLKLAARKGHVRKDVDVILLISTLVGTTNSLLYSRDQYKAYHNISGKKADTFEADYNQLIQHHTQNLLKYLLLHEA